MTAKTEETIKTKYGDHVYRIQVKHTTKKMYLDVKGASLTNGADVVIWSDDPGHQQRWLIMPVPNGGGKVYIVARHSGSFLDVIGAKREEGWQVGQYPYQAGDQQMWWLEDAEDGYVKIKNDGSNLYLEVYGAGTTDGSAVIQWNDHKIAQDKDDQQKWKLIREEKLSLPFLKTEGHFPKSPPDLTRDAKAPVTSPVLLHSELIPFYLVNDGTKTSDWKVRNSPYYLMSYSKKWLSLRLYPNETKNDSPLEFYIKNVEFDRLEKEVEKMVSATVSASSSWGWGEGSAEITGSLTTKDKEESGSSKEVVIKRKFTLAKWSKLGVWTDQRLYVLERMDGHVVKHWERNGLDYENGFPRPPNPGN